MVKKLNAPKRSSVPAPPPVTGGRPSKKAATEPLTVDERRKRLEALQEEINKQYRSTKGGQRGMLASADQFSNIYSLRRPFGIPTLDLGLAGGLPAGGLCEIFGPEGSTKSYLANLIIANVQQIYGDTAAVGLVMTESHHDKMFARASGVQIALSNKEIEMWNQAEAASGRPPIDPVWAKNQVGFIHQASNETAEGLLETAARMFEENLYQVIIIDSLGALIPSDEAEEGIQKRHYGGSSIAITQFMHRYHAAAMMPDPSGRPNTTTIIAINQFRANVGGGLFSVDWRIPGGHALRHGKVISLYVYSGAKKKITIGNEQVVVGKEIHWQTLKGKAGCHDGVTGEYDFYFGERGYPFGVNRYKDLVVAGLMHGVVEQDGAWYSYSGQRLGQGQENVWRALYENPALYTEIQKKIYDKAALKFITKECF